MTHIDTSNIDKEYIRANVTKEQAVWWLGCYDEYLKQVGVDPTHSDLGFGICWFIRYSAISCVFGYELWKCFEVSGTVFWDFSSQESGPTPERLTMLKEVSDKVKVLLEEGVFG